MIARTPEEWLDYFNRKIYIFRRLKEFEENLYKSGKLNKEKEEIRVERAHLSTIEEYQVPKILFRLKIFKFEKTGIPVKIEIGEIKLTEDERLCYCIDENYLEEFEKAFKI